MTPDRPFSFLRTNARETKPRSRGLTEIRGPYYTPMGKYYLQDILETMGIFVDSVKFAGGPFTLMPGDVVREIIELCRMVWRRQEVRYDGRAIKLPLPSEQGSGLGKALKILTHPVRDRIPIWLASMGVREQHALSGKAGPAPRLSVARATMDAVALGVASSLACARSPLQRTRTARQAPAIFRF